MNTVTRNLTGILTLMAVGTIMAADPPPLFPTLPDQPAASTPPPATNPPAGPRIKFATPVYDFGRVSAGDPIKYTFVFTNIGTEMLTLTAVQPSCGCTAAGEWTKQVEPGKTGSIPVQFNTTSYSGQVIKTINVSCNDKAQPTTMLQFKGTLWKPIDLTPPYGVLNVTPDATNATATVRIVNNTDQPVTLSAPQCNNPAFSAELKTVQEGKEFQLVLTTVAPLSPGSVQGQITLKTSLTNPPVVTVPAWINVQPPLSLIPPQINLAQAPLANRISSTVTIINNSAKPMTLSEPSLNLAGIEPQIVEVQAGRTFTVTMAFPQGFELPPGQRPEFTVKTSNPKVPVVRVPIFQIQAPATQPPANLPRAAAAALPQKLPPVPTAVPAPPTESH